ncbi:MAG TPA: DUF2147 domain-containing protein [Acetobacteraceae bacterium]|nr:DUF2147 domain-containing protein [Acetobacteraceae bacterium]
MAWPRATLSGAWLAGLICLVLSSPGLAASDVAGGAPFGDWLTEDRGGVIRLEPCGTGVCGRIVGMAQWQADGTVPRDVHGQSQCHMLILRDAQREAANLWSGSITNPNDGNSYGAEFWLDDSGRLHLRGYFAIPLFGSTQIWTRYGGTVLPDCHLR